MKSIIIYGSHHHRNTKHLAKAIAEAYGVDLWDAESEYAADLSAYDLIGFASGIDFGRFYPQVTEIAGQLPLRKSVFALYTCAKDNARYGDDIRSIALSRNCAFLGKFGCKGYNTYGPWKLIGGMNRNHPTTEEIADAIRFYGDILKKMAQ